METNLSPEIICPSCGRESLLKRETLYEGLRRAGVKLSCLSCGHVFGNAEEVPFKKKRSPRLFSKEDVPPPAKNFKEGEADRLCRYCADYVVNPFVQRCAKHRKIVEATDSCELFTPRPKPADPAEADDEKQNTL
jgi:hypothetical protein